MWKSSNLHRRRVPLALQLVLPGIFALAACGDSNGGGENQSNSERTEAASDRNADDPDSSTVSDRADPRSEPVEWEQLAARILCNRREELESIVGVDIVRAPIQDYHLGGGICSVEISEGWRFTNAYFRIGIDFGRYESPSELSEELLLCQSGHEVIQVDRTMEAAVCRKSSEQDNTQWLDHIILFTGDFVIVAELDSRLSSQYDPATLADILVDSTFEPTRG